MENYTDMVNLVQFPIVQGELHEYITGDEFQKYYL